jgi:N-acetylglucosamine-6-sulfatase
VVIVSALMLFLTLSEATAAPNIVFILADDLDNRTVDTMPHLQELARAGARLTRYYANVPLCAPARATLPTGQYAQNSDVRRNEPPFGGFETFFATGGPNRSIAPALQAAGYRTGFVGKYINGYPNTASATYIPPGWNYWFAPPQGDGNIHLKYDYDINDNGTIRHYGTAASDYSTDIFAAKARQFITDTPVTGPFALFLWLNSPHTPEQPAPRDGNAFASATIPRTVSFPETDVSDKPRHLRVGSRSASVMAEFDRRYRLRLQMLQSIDDAVEGVRHLLAERGQLSNTFIVFSSDNGWHHGEHNYDPQKGMAFEEDIRIPMIITGPGIPAGRQIARLIGNADVTPTFADWAGATLSWTVDGRSFADLLFAANPSAVSWRKRLPLYRLPKNRGPATTANLPPPIGCHHRLQVHVARPCLAQTMEPRRQLARVPWPAHGT